MSDPVDRVAAWVIEARRQKGLASGGIIPASAPASFAAITPTETILPRGIVLHLTGQADGSAVRAWFEKNKDLLRRAPRA